MIINIGYTQALNEITLYNVVQGYDLEDTRVVERELSENGSVWFNLRGKKKPTFSFDFEEIEYEDSTSIFKKIQELTIPDYLLPVWVKVENPNASNGYTIQTEYEGLAYIQLIAKSIGTVPTLRNFSISVFTL